MVASIFTLCAMSFDRYLAVGFPLRTKHLRTPRKALLAAICIWIMALLMAVPWPIFYTVREYTNWGPQSIFVCADDWSGVKEHKPTYFLLLFIFAYAVPLVTLSVLSTLMVRQLWLVEGHHYHPGTRTLESIKAKRKVTRLVIVIVVVFLVCWLPSHVVWLWTNYQRDTWQHTYLFYYLRISAHVLSYANSAMNPIIYAFLSKNFRRGFQRALLCKTRQLEMQSRRSSHVSMASSTRYASHKDRQLVPFTSFADFAT